MTADQRLITRFFNWISPGRKDQPDGHPRNLPHALGDSGVGEGVIIELLAETDPQSRGREAWLLDVVGPDGAVAGWHEAAGSSQWQPVETGEKSGPALVAREPATLLLQVPVGSRLVFLRHQWSGKVRVSCGTRVAELDLFSRLRTTVNFRVRAENDAHDAAAWTGEETAWLDRVKRAAPAVVSVLHPDWLGVRSATENLVSHSLLVEDDLDESEAERLAQLLIATGCRHIFYGGFPHSFVFLVEAVHKAAPDRRQYVFWLSSFLQVNEDYVWQSFLLIDDLCRSGKLVKWGFAKKGMAEVVGRRGVETGFIQSYIRQIPEGPSTPDPGGPHIGIWALAPIWRKLPYAMLAALVGVENAEVFVVGQDERALEFSRYLGLKIHLQPEPLARTEMNIALSRMHLNLYVTLSECSPMLPLESLAAGVPCLLGPTSHLFEDHAYLHSRLVVPSPDRSDCIVGYIGRALEEREEIISAYKDYAVEYNRQAGKSLTDFLGIAEDSIV